MERHIVRWQMNVIVIFSRLYIIDKMKCMWDRLSEDKVRFLRVRSVLRRIDKMKCSAAMDRALAAPALKFLQ